MAEAPQQPSRLNIFSNLRQRLQGLGSSPKPPPETQTATSEIDLTARIPNGEQQSIAIGGVVLAIRAAYDVAGNRIFCIEEINPGQPFSGTVRVISSDNTQMVIRKEMHGTSTKYNLVLERGNSAAIVDRPMERLVQIPPDGKIQLVPSSDVRYPKIQEVQIQNWVLMPPIQTGPGK